MTATLNRRRASPVPKPIAPAPGGTDSRRAEVFASPMGGSPAESSPDSTKENTVAMPNSSDPPNSRSANRPTSSMSDSPSGLNSPAAEPGPTPFRQAPQEPASSATKKLPAPINLASRGTKSAGRRVPSANHGTDAAGINSRSAVVEATPDGDAPSGLNVPGPAASDGSTPIVFALLDPALSLAADVLDDIERVRIANENRIRQMTTSTEDSDGEIRGFGFDPDHPDVLRIAVLVHALKGLEHDATLELQRKMRKHPLGAWMKTQRGIGEKQGARLLAAIGDPYINSAKGQPRTVSALWAYCGLHVLPGGHFMSDDHGGTAAGDQHRDTDQGSLDSQHPGVGVAAKRRKGQRANWSTKAKMRAYLIAVSCMQAGRSPGCRGGHTGGGDQTSSAVPAQNPQAGAGHRVVDAQTRDAVPACDCSPYRLVYESRRAHTAVTHPDWTDGHSHNDALRVVSKEVLKQLWRAAREWHLANGDKP